MSADLALGAVYERNLEASLERVWENVHDWEHLPWLHNSAFSDISLEEVAEWGWRAQVVGPVERGARRTRIELKREPGAERYHTRTLDGPTQGADTVTTLTPHGPRKTHVRVEFFLPEQNPARVRRMGEDLRATYERLWDEDEGMMIQRQAWLDRTRWRQSEPVALGHVDRLRDRLPLVLEANGQAFRILEVKGRLLAHSTTCPHWGGPLDHAPLRGETLVCPWHGDRFALEDGRNLSERACRLQPLAFVQISASGEASLHFEPPGHLESGGA